MYSNIDSIYNSALHIESIQWNLHITVFINIIIIIIINTRKTFQEESDTQVVLSQYRAKINDILKFWQWH